MAAGMPGPDEFGKMILAAVQRRTQEIIDEEAEKMTQMVQKRIAGMADIIALEIFRQYDLSMDRDRILISVKKEI